MYRVPRDRDGLMVAIAGILSSDLEDLCATVVSELHPERVLIQVEDRRHTLPTSNPTQASRLFVFIARRRKDALNIMSTE